MTAPLSLVDLELNQRTISVLNEEGMSLSDLLNMTEREFLMLPNIGKQSLVEERAVLASHGLPFKGSNHAAYAAPLPQPSCLTCRYYLIADGLCRRYPPVVIGGPTAKKNPDGSPVMTWANVFPGMQATGWCGEYRE